MYKDPNEILMMILDMRNLYWIPESGQSRWQTVQENLNHNSRARATTSDQQQQKTGSDNST